ncbi:MAG: porin [Bermanella sp.]
MKNGLLYSFLTCLLVTPTQAYAADPPSVNVYGRIHFRLIEQNDKNTNLSNAGHRIGLRGEGKLDNGYDFFYTLETEYKNDSGFGKNNGIGGKDVTKNSSRSSTDLADIVVRHAHAGLKTKLGSLTIGRQNNPLNATYVADVFEANSGYGEQSPYRIGNAIVYKAKSVAGVKGYAGAMLEGGASDGTDEQELTGAVFGGAYSIAGIHINAGYFLADYTLDTAATSTKTEFTDWSVGVSYSMGEMYFGVNVESSTSDTDGAETDTDVIDLAATYSMKSVTYGVGYASKDDGTDTKTRILLGAYVNLGGNSDCYFETGQYNEEAGDGDNYVFGYRVKF